jgi:Cu-Zn family superoxide dismutase
MRGWIVTAALVLAGCAVAKAPAPPPVTATAVLEARAGSTLSGTAVFSALEGGEILLRIEVAGVTPGPHAVHIHEHADCGDPDAKNAGGHWNPTAKPHGRWGQPDGAYHLGDLGNIEVGADGTGSLEIRTGLWTLRDGGPLDVVGRSIIVHAKPDDFTTQPTGNAGDRIGCGPIL